MKRLIYFLSVCIFIVLGGCTEEPTVTTGSISGIVMNASGGSDPISGVNVSIPVLGESTTTGSTGAFSFSDIQAGTYVLTFTKSGYVTEQRNVSVVAGKPATVNVQMKATEQKAEIEFNPSSLNFSTTLSDLSVTIKNNGNATAEWSLNLGNNPWLSVSEKAGSIQSGRTQSIVFSVDRNYLSEPKSTVVNLHAFGNSYPLTISCAPSNAKSEMTIEPKSIDFGSSDTEKSLTIRNTGTATLSWTASGLTESALSLSQQSGSVAAGGNTVIKVLLDRSILSGSLSTSFTINDGVRSEQISVTANTSGSGSGDNQGGGETPTGLVETKGLYAYFPFNGNLDDVWENKINGYVSPEDKYVTGVSDGTQGLAFARKDGTVFSVNEGLIDTPNMTLSFWLKDISEGDISYVTTSDGSKMMSLAYKNGHLKYVMTRDHVRYSYNQYGDFTHKAIDDGDWHHIVLVSDFNTLTPNAVTLSLYVDGVLMDTLTEGYSASSENDQSGRHFGVGTKFILGGNNTPNMRVANLRVYDNRKLNASQVKNIFNVKQ